MEQDFLYVFLNNNFVGKLSQDELGGVEFQYDKNAKTM